MCEVRSKKNGQEQKEKNKIKNTVVSRKNKSTVMSPIRRRMKKRNPSSGQNDQLVHWWLLIHSGCMNQERQKTIRARSINLPKNFKLAGTVNNNQILEYIIE
jgi:murein L,D-transpeptidase YafK